jgi:hypothetical protein
MSNHVESAANNSPTEGIEDIAYLRNKAAELQKRLDAIHRDYRQGLHADSEERAQQLENAEVLNEIERVTAESLAQVKEQIAALSE